MMLDARQPKIADRNL